MSIADESSVYDWVFLDKADGAKPCPMCGSNRIGYMSRKLYKEAELRSVNITCVDCGLSLYGDDVAKEAGLDADYDRLCVGALEKWNRRVN